MKHLLLLLTIFVIYGCEAPPKPDCTAYTHIDNIHYWNGKIKNNSYMCFDWNDLDTLIITSTGGDIGGAAAISTDIKAFKITTIASGYCYSACIIIYSHGIDRQYFSYTQFGIHLSKKGNKYLNLYDNRVDTNWIGDNMAPYLDMYIFGVKPAIEHGLTDIWIKGRDRTRPN